MNQENITTVRRCPVCNSIMLEIPKTIYKKAYSKCYDCGYEEPSHVICE